MKLSDDQLYLMKHGMKFEDVKDMSADDLRDNVRRMKSIGAPQPKPFVPPKRLQESKWWSVLLFVVVGFIILVITTDDGPSNKPVFQTSPSTTTTAYTPPKTPQVIKISVGRLFQDYEDNEVATDERHQGVHTEITGTVQSVDKNVWGSMILALKTKNEFMPANMFMEESEKSALQRIKRGQNVAVRCERVVRWVGAPNGHSCTLVSK